MTQSLGYPPRRIHSTVQLSQAEVLEDVTRYLNLASSHPALHPNAMLTEQGPVAVNHGETSGLALHNLKRLQSGLRGEHLVPDPSLLSGLARVGKGKAPLRYSGATSESEDQQGWQDRGEFDREQEVSVGHADGTDPPVIQEEVAIRSFAGTTASGQANGVVVSIPGKGSRKFDASDRTEKDEASRKALRKQMKKERNKAEKRAKADKHQKSNEG